MTQTNLNGAWSAWWQVHERKREHSDLEFIRSMFYSLLYVAFSAVGKQSLSELRWY